MNEEKSRFSRNKVVIKKTPTQEKEATKLFFCIQDNTISVCVIAIYFEVRERETRISLIVVLDVFTLIHCLLLYSLGCQIVLKSKWAYILSVTEKTISNH